MRVNTRRAVLTAMVIGCHSGGEDDEKSVSDYGIGGGQPELTLPFPSGEYWLVSQGYNTGSHQDYNFNYGDDSYALDFAQNGCEAYGKEVTPVADGWVIKVTEDGYGDSGYGNSVLINHDNGYVSRYGHFSETLVSEGDYVTVYDSIGLVGNTGYVLGHACGEHPGTHLHLAFYLEGQGIPPEPVSGNSRLRTRCWYNREGVESCDGDPGPYEPEEGGNSDDEHNTNDGDDEHDENLSVSDLNVSPDWGTASETNFVWTTVVNSVDRPDVTLWITNENDGDSYSFEMDTESTESPWVFFYRKTLRDDLEYPFWVEVNSDGDTVESDTEWMEVWNSSEENPPEDYSYGWSPDEGDAGETEFSWSLRFTGEGSSTATLHIVNPADGEVYDFDMDAWESGDDIWSASFEKTLRDSTVYPFWVSMEDRNTTNTTEVGTVRVE
jgi:hypothetical protein